MTDPLQTWLDSRNEAQRPAAFEALLARHGAAIQRACRGHERDPQRRDELVQDVLVAVWRAMPRFEGRASLKTWSLRIAHNVALTHVGRERRDPVVPVAAPREDAARGSTDRTVDQARQRARLLSAVQELPPIDRTLMLLWLEDLGTAELAEATGLSPSNVTTRLSRLRQRLTRSLSPEQR